MSEIIESTKEKITSFFNVSNADEAEAVVKLHPKNIKICDSYVRVRVGMNKYKYVSVFELSIPNDSTHDFDAMWGISLIPKDYRNMGVDITLIDATRPYSDLWVNAHRETAEASANINYATQSDDGSITEYQKSLNAINDIAMTSNELINGASYIDTTHFLILSSASLKKLNEVTKLLKQDLNRDLGAVDMSTAPFLQKYVLQCVARGGLDNIPKAKQAHWSMSSTQYGGFYNYLSKSILDTTGEFVGTRFNDIFSSPVIFDFDLFKKSAAIIDPARMRIGNTLVNMSDYLAARAEISVICEQHRVVHINLTNKPLITAPYFKDITTVIDANNRINPFEIFGTDETVLSDFSEHIEKMSLLFRQLVKGDADTESIMVGNLSSLLSEFYIDQGMWSPDARNHLDRLRVIGIPHNQTPRLRDFVPYLETRYKEATSMKSNDPKQIGALNILRLTFNTLLDINGDIFDTFTSEVFDRHLSSQVITFDLSKLMSRSSGLAMAQLINVFNIACTNVSDGDVIIIHGAETISEDVFKFIQTRLTHTTDHGGRFIMTFNSLTDNSLAIAGEADYSIFGKLSGEYSDKLQAVYHTSFTETLNNSITSMNDNEVFIKRLLPDCANEALCKLDMIYINKLIGGIRNENKSSKKTAQ